MRQKCCTCGRPATTTTPMWHPVKNTLEIAPQCESCQKDFLKMCRKGPEIKRGLRGRAPGYYFQALNTWFQQMAGAWPCPDCPEFFDSFADVVKHFVEKHFEEAKPLEQVTVEGVKTVRSWQGIYCPVCAYLCNNEKHLLMHYRRAHGSGQ